VTVVDPKRRPTWKPERRSWFLAHGEEVGHLLRADLLEVRDKDGSAIWTGKTPRSGVIGNERSGRRNEAIRKNGLNRANTVHVSPRASVEVAGRKDRRR